MVKYSVVVVSDDITRFVNCISRIVPSLGMKSELMVIWNGDPSLFDTVNTLLRNYCSPSNIPHVVNPYKNSSLSSAWNFAMDTVKGSYVALLTDKVLVSEGFLTKLVYCMDNYTSSYKAGPVGVVVPITDYAVARQQVDIPNEIHDVNAKQEYLSDKISKKYGTQAPWMIAGDVSTFCMLVKKEVYDKLSFPIFDTEFDAHSWFTNVLFSGYYVVIAGDVYVGRIIEEGKKLFYGYESHVRDLTGSPSAKEIGFLYRIVINDEYERDIFIRSLEKTVDLTYNIFVLDVNSRIGMKMYLKEKRPDLWEKITKYEKVVRPLDDSTDYNQLRSWADDAHMTWSFCIEGDEILEDKVNRDLLDKLTNPPDWSVLAYTCALYIMWDGENKCRLDPPWNQINEVRLINLRPGWKIPAGSYGRAPMLPPEHVRMCSIRVQCYGYVKPEQRKLKIQAFEKMGVNKDPGHAAFVFYKSLLEEFKAMVYPWVECSGISVYTPIRGGNNLLIDDWIGQSWAFADEIVIGDDNMDSATKKRLEQWRGEDRCLKFVPIEVKDNFAEARNQIIKQCSQDWIFSLDLDERFNGWGAVRRYMDHPYYNGYLFPIDNYRRLGSPFGSGTIRLFQNNPEVRYWGLLHETIDDFVREHSWHIDRSTVKIQHYGYVLGSVHELFKKMQRYLEMNLKQIKKYPKDGRAYHNLAMHLLEDGMMDEAVLLLKIASTFSPKYGIPAEELSKFYITTAQQWARKALSFAGPEKRSTYFVELYKQLTRLLPSYLPAASGHCYTYFRIHKDELKWMRQHCREIARSLTTDSFPS